MEKLIIQKNLNLNMIRSFKNPAGAEWFLNCLGQLSEHQALWGKKLNSLVEALNNFSIVF